MKHLSTFALALGLAAVSACGAAGTGTVTTSVTGEGSSVASAPAYAPAAKPDNTGGTADSAVTGGVSAVKLQIVKIAAHNGDESGGNESEGAEKDGDNGWEVLFSGNKEIDLMKAATDATEAVLGTSSLQEGKYTQIRLYLKDTGNVITVNGADVPLTVPSGALKLVGNATVAADKTYKLEIKFDLDHSLVMNTQGYKLKPTVKYTLTEK